jgi:hypothetical protein
LTAAGWKPAGARSWGVALGADEEPVANAATAAAVARAATTSSGRIRVLARGNRFKWLRVPVRRCT